MSDLINFTDAELRKEQRRREAARAAGMCDVCSAWYDEPSCGSPRHDAASNQWYRRWKFDYGSSYLSAYKRDSEHDERIRVTVSRYGTRVYITAPSADMPTMGTTIAETELPVDYTDDHPRSNMSDEERLRWAIDWAIEQLAELTSP